MNKLMFFVKYNMIDFLRFPHYRVKVRDGIAFAKKENNNQFSLSDMIYKCYRLKASFEDYFWFKMYLKSFDACDKFTTLGRHLDLFSKINKKENKQVFGDKPVFNSVFKEYINRDFLDLRTSSLDEFKNFTLKHPVFISKPAGGSSGYKVEKKNINDYASVEKLFKELKENKCFDVEEIIIQHPDMAKLHAESVNTIRLITAKKDGVFSFFKAALRIGTGKNVADNFNRDGIGCLLDSSGKIISNGITKRMDVIYEKHPDTGITLKGFQVPNFEIAKKLCIKASYVLEMDFIGFDIAITKDGCVIVEANSTPLYDLTQMPLQQGEYYELLKALELK